MTRATSSLPEPAPPRISTRLLVGATRSMERAQLVDGRRLADHLGADHRALAQLAHLALQLGGLERAQRHEQQPVGLERLLDVVVGAALDGGDRGLDVAVAGDDDHRQVGVRLLDDVEHLQAVEAAALQPDVEDDELRPALLDRLQGLVANRAPGACGDRRPAGCRRPSRGCPPRRRRSGCRMPSVAPSLVGNHAPPSAAAAAGSSRDDVCRPAPCSPAARCGSARRACGRAPAARPPATACRRAAPRSSARWRGRGRCPCCPWW